MEAIRLDQFVCPSLKTATSLSNNACPRRSRATILPSGSSKKLAGIWFTPYIIAPSFLDPLRSETFTVLPSSSRLEGQLCIR